MNTMVLAPACAGPQAIPCLAVLGVLSIAGIAAMSPSSGDIGSSDQAADNDLAGTDTGTCTGDCAEECARLIAEIESDAMAVQRRLEDMVEDPHDLYNTARGLADDWGKGSWAGHINRYERERSELKAKIALADSKGCQVSDFARDVANEGPPVRPGYD